MIKTDLTQAIDRLGDAVERAVADRIRPSRRKGREFPKPRPKERAAFIKQFVEGSNAHR